MRVAKGVTVSRPLVVTVRGLVKIDFQRLSFLGVFGGCKLPLAPGDDKDHDARNKKDAVNEN